jgi:aspartyl-tRNA(Asn)/glutamyl-tRNA(Gln) amidotransferase subunit B
VSELRGTAIDEKRRRTLTAYLTGKVLAATGGRADPKIAASLIDELIQRK